MRKRMLSILISLAMLLSLSTGFVSATSDEIVESGVVGDITWTYTSSGLLTIRGTGNSQMEDYPTSFFTPWFGVSFGVTDVVITGVAHLGDMAFYCFPSLRTISFDNCIRSIGFAAVDGCTALRTVTFTGDPPALGRWAFPTEGYEIVHPNTRAWTQSVIDQFYLGEPTTTPTAPSIPCDITEQEVYDILISMKEEYYEGRHWTNNDGYSWNGRPNETGYGCAGFAYILSDAAFGEQPAKLITENITIDMIRVGDILRINHDTHSVIVLEVHDFHIIVAEGNYNSSIHWGRKLSHFEVALNTDYVLTRYPEHSWVDASCEAPKGCLFCDTTEGEPLGHDYDAGGICTRCGENLNCQHEWVEATCTDPKYCRLCDKTEGDPLPHTLTVATCKTPATCTVCGTTQGVASSIHTYDGNSDAECNVCGAERLLARPITNNILISGAERELLRLTNLERLEKGLQPFATFAPLQDVAQVRAREIKTLFDHTRPNGEMFNTALYEGGLTGNCGENLGKLQKSPSEVLGNWMNSASHRDNILNNGFGLMAAAENDLHWVQYFLEGVRFTTMQVLIPEGFVYYPGTPIARMSLNAYLTDAEGNVYLIPLDDSYCTGYDTSNFGAQTFTVNLLGFTWEMTLGDPGETPTTPPETEGLMGDVTDDGKADYSDALFILRASIGLETLTEEQKQLADVNGDGKQDYSDALQILRASIGL